jgi:hypothetical protein
VSEAPILTSSPDTGGYGLFGVLGPRFLFGTRFGRPVAVRAVEAACGVAVARGDSPGYSWAPTLPTGIWVNVGSVPAVPPNPSGLGGTVRCCRPGVAEDP